eukprot:4522177-Pleurochrysis_carterae.AAC.1
MPIQHLRVACVVSKCGTGPPSARARLVCQSVNLRFPDLFAASSQESHGSDDGNARRKHGLHAKPATGTELRATVRGLCLASCIVKVPQQAAVSVHVALLPVSPVRTYVCTRQT